MEDNSKELNGFLTAMNKKRNDLFFTILVPKKSHFTRRLDQFKNVEYVQDIENRFEEPGKEISSMPYINKYIYDKLDTLKKNHQTGLSRRDERVMNLMENMRESFFMSERWAATYNPANFRSVKAHNDKPRLFWRDWDVDLVLSFHPAIMHKHINHFKKNTDMDPKYISLCSKQYWEIIKKWDGHLSIPSVFRNKNNHGFFVENNDIAIELFSSIIALNDKKLLQKYVKSLSNIDFNWKKRKTLDSLNHIISDAVDNLKPLKKVNPAYQKMRNFIRTKKLVSKRELINKMEWGKSSNFHPYRNRLRMENNIRFINNHSYEWIA